MNIDKTMAEIQTRIPNVTLALYQTMVEDQHMEAIRVRRKAQGQTHHRLWAFSASYPDASGNQANTIFYDHKPQGALKKCMAWLGMPTVSRGPKANAAGNGQPQA